MDVLRFIGWMVAKTLFYGIFLAIGLSFIGGVFYLAMCIVGLATYFCYAHAIPVTTMKEVFIMGSVISIYLFIGTAFLVGIPLGIVDFIKMMYKDYKAEMGSLS